MMQTKSDVILGAMAFLLAMAVIFALLDFSTKVSDQTTSSIQLCRTDAELAALPTDTMSQQRCAEPLPFGG